MNTQGFKKKLRQIVWRFIIVISILFNLSCILDQMALPDFKLGVLEQDITIAEFANDSKKLFKLPKGLTVMDFSPRGIATFGLFHPNRFSIVVTHGSNVIDYSSSTKKSPWGALYQVHIPSETNESNQ
jgi:hypothetical protein